MRLSEGGGEDRWRFDDALAMALGGPLTRWQAKCFGCRWRASRPTDRRVIPCACLWGRDALSHLPDVKPPRLGFGMKHPPTALVGVPLAPCGPAVGSAGDVGLLHPERMTVLTVSTDRVLGDMTQQSALSSGARRAFICAGTYSGP